MDHRFILVDVFAGQPFSGNQLAVFPDARGLSDRAMQALTREINFAETTFVLPARLEGALRRVRIFTPRSEVPFAGHPTIGTAAVLAHLGVLEWHGDAAKATLEEGVGPVRVTVSSGVVAPFFTELALEPSVELPAVRPDRGRVAAALSLEPTDLLDCWFASVGLPFCFAHVASRAAVDRACLERSVWRDSIANGWSPHLYFFAGDVGDEARGKIHARMFAPALGFEEDPATGSAAAALAGKLAARANGMDADVALDIEQGVAMKRPSRIHASATKRRGIVDRVSVAGSSVIVGRGTMHVPDGH